MSSSLERWNRLPEGFLKKRFRAWDRYDRELQLVIIEVARKQGFKCAFCSEDRELIIEHDHEPEDGDGDQVTIQFQRFDLSAL
jgi:hypothetical protein